MRRSSIPAEQASRIRKDSPKFDNQQHDGDSTTDESEPDIQPPPHKHQSPLQDLKTISRRPLTSSGHIGNGAFEASIELDSNDREHHTTTPRSRRSDHAKSSVSTASSDEDVPHAAHASRDASNAVKGNALANNPISTKRKAKLGKIGGISKTNSVARTSTPVKVDTKSKPEKSRSALHDDHERAGRLIVQGDALTHPRETSQERADRKRAQLKRELEAKSQAGTKKKRRF